MSKLTAAEGAVLNNVTYVMSSLSLIGSLSVIVIFLSLKELRRFPLTLVLLLSLNDIASMSLWLSGPSPQALARMAATPGLVTPDCYTQATLLSTVITASILWTCAISTTIYCTVVLDWNLEARACSWVLWWSVGIYAFALPLSLIPLSTPGVYGPAGLWCWITSTNSNVTLWRIMINYLWIWLGALYNVVLVVLVRMKLQRSVKALAVGGSVSNANDQSSAIFIEQLKASVVRMQWYPAVIIFVWFWPSVNRLYEASTGNQVFWLYFLHRLTTSLQGFLNALIYSYAVRRALWARMPLQMQQCVRRLCCCCLASSLVPTLGGFSSVSEAESVLRIGKVTVRDDLITDLAREGSIVAADAEEELANAPTRVVAAAGSAVAAPKAGGASDGVSVAGAVVRVGGAAASPALPQPIPGASAGTSRGGGAVLSSSVVAESQSQWGRKNAPQPRLSAFSVSAPTGRAGAASLPSSLFQTPSLVSASVGGDDGDAAFENDDFDDDAAMPPSGGVSFSSATYVRGQVGGVGRGPHGGLAASNATVIRNPLTGALPTEISLSNLGSMGGSPSSLRWVVSSEAAVAGDAAVGAEEIATANAASSARGGATVSADESAPAQ